MRDHELELIAALVEGQLEDETEARALVASGPEYQDEYEAQKLAYEALREAGPTAMTGSEQAALHRDVWTTLRTEAAARPAKLPWYYRWAPVAAGLFVVVGIVAVISQGGGDDAIESADLAADLPVETTVASDDALQPQGEQDEAPGTAGAEEEMAEESSDTTEASTTETTAAEAAGGDGAADSDEAIAVYESEAESMRQGVFGPRSQSYVADPATDETIEACIGDAGLEDQRVIATLTPPRGDSEVAVAIPEDAEMATAPIAFISLDTCELVFLDE